LAGQARVVEESQLPYSTISTLDGSSRKKAEPLLIPESRNSSILSRNTDAAMGHASYKGRAKRGFAPRTPLDLDRFRAGRHQAPLYRSRNPCALDNVRRAAVVSDTLEGEANLDVQRTQDLPFHVSSQSGAGPEVAQLRKKLRRNRNRLNRKDEELVRLRRELVQAQTSVPEIACPSSSWWGRRNPGPPGYASPSLAPRDTLPWRRQAVWQGLPANPSRCPCPIGAISVLAASKPMDLARERSELEISWPPVSTT
jgi:hypothetical protein